MNRIHAEVSIASSIATLLAVFNSRDFRFTLRTSKGIPVQPPQQPVGPVVEKTMLSTDERNELISIIARAPGRLKAAVADLSPEQLSQKYVNWTIRQIVHHLGDSHIHSYARFKWALTEDNPTIKPYDETLCADLPDSKEGCILAPLALFEGLHGRWVQLLRSMNSEQFSRTFYHPASQRTVTLDAALCYYAWHCRHHTGQIEWLRSQLGW
ncbi:MAG: putative metal-dependent hydrolase [Planctomycetaceae bacterium]|nr:putative metal-dependent hydrolase [Planctomycetaceae bacterium]